MQEKPDKWRLRKHLFPIAIIALLFIMPSCDNTRYYEEFIEVDPTGWDFQDSIHFQTMVQDSLGYYNFLVEFRHSTAYPYSNIYLYIKTLLPDGRYALDTLSYQLAEPDGKWLGSGYSDIKSISLPFQKDIIFPVTGNYQFIITHGMRDTLLIGMKDIGFRIEKVFEN